MTYLFSDRSLTPAEVLALQRTVRGEPRIKTLEILNANGVFYSRITLDEAIEKLKCSDTEAMLDDGVLQIRYVPNPAEAELHLAKAWFNADPRPELTSADDAIAALDEKHRKAYDIVYARHQCLAFFIVDVDTEINRLNALKQQVEEERVKQLDLINLLHKIGSEALEEKEKKKNVPSSDSSIRPDMDSGTETSAGGGGGSLD